MEEKDLEITEKTIGYIAGPLGQVLPRAHTHS
jgi:hypothetical protein